MTVLGGESPPHGFLAGTNPLRCAPPCNARNLNHEGTRGTKRTESIEPFPVSPSCLFVLFVVFPYKLKNAGIKISR